MGFLCVQHEILVNPWISWTEPSHASYIVRYGLKSTELTRGPPSPSWFSTFVSRRVHIEARALHVLNLIWFGWIARLAQWGGGGVISSFKWFLPAFPRVEGGGSAPCGHGFQLVARQSSLATSRPREMLPSVWNFRIFRQAVLNGICLGCRSTKALHLWSSRLQRALSWR